MSRFVVACVEPLHATVKAVTAPHVSRFVVACVEPWTVVWSHADGQAAAHD